jgi:NAD(P)-dependent dehydrogenase (short-subunit alcohol dehydrogenase family)
MPSTSPTFSSSTGPKLAHYRSLQGQRVFITGGGTGIGAAMVEAFAEQGAQVAFVDFAEAESTALVQKIVSAGHPKPWFCHCDVRDVAALQKAVTDATAALGDFSTLINNVARDDRHTLESVTPEYWEERMAVNQRPAFFAIQAIVPGMKRLGGGSIINFGSTGWQTKGAAYPCYAIAKSAVNGLTRGLAASLGQERIRVNTISPGWVMTERQIKMWLDEEGEKEIKRNQCLPDKLTPSDVARMALFLASDDGAMCTAQEFKVDAGWN